MARRLRRRGGPLAKQNGRYLFDFDIASIAPIALASIASGRRVARIAQGGRHHTATLVPWQRLQAPSVVQTDFKKLSIADESPQEVRERIAAIARRRRQVQQDDASVRPPAEALRSKTPGSLGALESCHNWVWCA